MGANCCSEADQRGTRFESAPESGRRMKIVHDMDKPLDEQYYKDLVETTWKDFETNEQGNLEHEEAIKFLKVITKLVTQEESTDEEAEKNFSLIDIDKDGAIDKEEALKFMKGLRVSMVLKQLTKKQKLGRTKSL